MATDELLRNKKIEDMRVVDLRAALEKRNLDKSGVKAVLVERLRKALGEEDDGMDSIDHPELSNTNCSNGEMNASEDNIESSLPQESTAEVQEETEEPEPTSDVIAADDTTEENNSANDSRTVGEEVPAECEEFGEELKLGDQSQTQAQDTPKQENEQEKNTEEATPAVSVQEKKEEDKGEMYEQMEEDEQIYEGDEARSEVDQTQSEEAKATGNLEDTINFMVEEDDMLVDDMIFEDGSTNKPAQEGVFGNKADGPVGSKTDEAVSSQGASSSKNSPRSTAGDGRSAQQTGSSNDAASASTDKSESGHKSNSSSSRKRDVHSDSSKGSSGRHLWISGLASSIRAQDLKFLLSKYGKVISARIVTSAKTPGSKCFGVVTMSSSDEASRCIRHCNKTELHGRIIHVERQARGDPASSNRNRRSRSRGKINGNEVKVPVTADGAEASQPKDEASRDKEHKKDGVDEDKKDDGRHSRTSRDRGKTSRDHSRERRRYSAPRPMRTPLGGRRSPNSRDGSRLSDQQGPSPLASNGRRSRSSGNRRSPPPPGRRGDRELGLNQIMEERERERVRARERIMREDVRRARVDDARQRIIERRQREEADRLHRERQQLRMERERIERQKQELLWLEREQQRMEREKLEREREELRRQKVKLLNNDGPIINKGSRYDDIRPSGRSIKRPAEERLEPYDDRKRPALSSRGAMDDSRSRYDDHSSHRRSDHYYSDRRGDGGRGVDGSSDSRRDYSSAGSASASSIINPSSIVPPPPQLSRPRDGNPSQWRWYGMAGEGASQAESSSSGTSSWRTSTSSSSAPARWEMRSTDNVGSGSRGKTFGLSEYLRANISDMNPMASTHSGSIPQIEPESQPGRGYALPSSAYRKY